MSASVTSRSSMTKPPWSIRLCVTNCSSSSAMAGPEYAVQPLRSRNCRCRSRGSTDSRSVRARRNWIRPWMVLAGLSILKPKPTAQLGSATRFRTPLSTTSPARRATTSGRDGDRQRRRRVGRRTERHERVEALPAPVGRGLVGEHAALRVPGQYDVAAGGGVDPVDRVAHREDVVGQVALQPARLVTRVAEVDHPRVDAASCRWATADVAGETSQTSVAIISGGTSSTGVASSGTASLK